MAITVKGRKTRGKRRPRGGGSAYGGRPSYSDGETQGSGTRSDPYRKSTPTTSKERDIDAARLEAEAAARERATGTRLTGVEIRERRAAGDRSVNFASRQPRAMPTGSDFVLTDSKGRSIGVSKGVAEKVARDEAEQANIYAAAASEGVGSRSMTATGKEVFKGMTPPAYVVVGDLLPERTAAIKQARQGPPRPSEQFVFRGGSRGMSNLPRKERFDTTGLGRDFRRITLEGEQAARFFEGTGTGAGAFAGGVTRAVTEDPGRTLRQAGYGALVGGGTGLLFRIPGVGASALRLASSGTATRATFAVAASTPVISQAAAAPFGVAPGKTGRFIGEIAPSAAGFGVGFAATAPRAGVVFAGEPVSRRFMVAGRSNVISKGRTTQQAILQNSFGTKQAVTFTEDTAATLSETGISQIRAGGVRMTYPSGFSTQVTKPANVPGFIVSINERPTFVGVGGGRRVVSRSLLGITKPQGKRVLTEDFGFSAMISRGGTAASGFQQFGTFTRLSSRRVAGPVVARFRSTTRGYPYAEDFFRAGSARPSTGLLSSRAGSVGARGVIRPTLVRPPITGFNVPLSVPRIGTGFFRTAVGGGLALKGFSRVSSASKQFGSSIRSSNIGLSSQGMRLSSSQALGFDTSVGTMPGVSSASRLGFGLGQSSASRLASTSLLITGLGSSTPPPPPTITPGTPGMPGFGIPPLPAWGVGSGRGRKGRKGRRGYRYNPSLSAIFGGVTTTKPTNILTGLEVRGVLR